MLRAKGYAFYFRRPSFALARLSRDTSVIVNPSRYQQGTEKVGSLRTTMGSLSFTAYGARTG